MDTLHEEALGYKKFELHEAVERQELEKIVAILENPRRVHDRNDINQIPLHLVGTTYKKATNINLKIVQLLLDKGSDTNALDDNEYLPIHYTIDGPPEIFLLFFEKLYQENQIESSHWNFSGDKMVRDVIQYSIVRNSPKVFCVILDKLCKNNKLTSTTWESLFRWNILQYELYLHASHDLVRNIHDTIPNEDCIVAEGTLYQKYEPTLFETLLQKTPSDVDYDYLLDLIVTYTQEGIRERLEDDTADVILELGQDTYFNKKAGKLIALLIAYRSNFGFDTHYTWDLFSYLRPVVNNIEIELKKSLKKSFFSSYINTISEKRLNINSKVFDVSQTQVLDNYRLTARVWPRWNYENKLLTLYTWQLFKKGTVPKDVPAEKVFIKAGIFQELPMELKYKIIGMVCCETLEKTVSENLPSFPYHDTQKVTQITNSLFPQNLIEAFENFHAAFNSQNKPTFSKEKLTQDLSQEFSIFSYTKDRLNEEVDCLVEKQIAILSQSRFEEKSNSEEEQTLPSLSHGI